MNYPLYHLQKQNNAQKKSNKCKKPKTMAPCFLIDILTTKQPIANYLQYKNVQRHECAKILFVQ